MTLLTHAVDACPQPGRARRSRPARGLTALGAAAALVLAGAGSSGATTPQEAQEAELIAGVNGDRAAAGLGPLEVSPRLTELARLHSAAMAGGGHLAHSTDLITQVSDWVSWGENVGYGGSPGAVHAMLLDSAPHRDNIRHAGARRMGIGVVTDAAGRVWVTEVFVQPH